MNTFPDWQKNIRQAQSERDERKRQRDEAERKAKEEREAAQRQDANRLFSMVLSKLLGIMITLDPNGQFVANPYTFTLLSAREYAIRDTPTLYVDCTLKIERGGCVIPMTVAQQPKDADTWPSYAAGVADYLDVLDKMVAKAEKDAKAGEQTLEQYENNALPSCGICGSKEITFMGLDDPMVPTMRIYTCNKCGAEVLDHATNEDGAVGRGAYHPTVDSGFDFEY